ncbi:hypothetical protein AKJ09_01427 [Labilithrix luteola]|uniref:WW domain-containing protein n=1 Tax=Labilithrix luteola TaxID=1391654 RepID=A0A0K1PML5_9BACT|nr:hypothetical protein [Labilithrix luteola]AKU94763.1 hypothetical protein AKJ09_01427 [Labilithrix luteola]
MKRRRSLGATLVETLAVVGIVALAAIAAYVGFGDSIRGTTQREAACVQTFSCGGGSNAGGTAAMAGQGEGGGTSSGGGEGSAQASQGWGSATWDFAKGFVSEGWEAVEGIADIVIHPDQVAQGVAQVILHPKDTWDAVKAEWQGRSGANNAGRVAFEIVTLPLVAGKLSKLSTAAKVAEDAAAVAKAAEAAKLADASKAAEAAAAAAAKTTESGGRVLLGEGAFSVAYREGDMVSKTIKDVVKDGNGVERALTLAEREKLAEYTAELTNNAADAVGGGLVPKLGVEPGGVLKQKYVEGMSLDDLKKVNMDAFDRAVDQKTGLVRKVEREFGLERDGYLETPEGWHAIVDDNIANFKFDREGNVTSWFDPVAVFPNKVP